MRLGTSEMKDPPSYSAIFASARHSTSLFFHTSVRVKSKKDCRVVRDITVESWYAKSIFGVYRSMIIPIKAYTLKSAFSNYLALSS